MMLSKVQVAHLIIYSQVVSPCKRYLAAGTNFGYIAIFNMNNALDRCNSKLNNSEPHVNKPLLVWLGHSDGGSYSLTSSDDFLISGGLGEIVGWRWCDVTSNTSLEVPEIAWKLMVPKLDSLNIAEVNSMYLDSTNSQLFAGCGDSKVHCFDISTGRLLSSFTGHKKYVHCVAPAGVHELITGSEDGTVRVWDLRCRGSSTQCIRPGEAAELGRPRHGDWITTARCDGENWDWMVCGGGPRLAIWHMRALKHTTVLEPDANAGDWTAQSALFLPDRVVAGGSQSRLLHWHVDGSLQASVPTSASHVMQVDREGDGTEAGGLLVACGTRKRIDIFGGLGYSKATLQF